MRQNLMRHGEMLRQGWRFCVDLHAQGEKDGYALPTCADADWREVELPVTVDRILPELLAYRGVCWFRRAFDNPARAGERLVLRIGAVAGRMRVFCDGACILSTVDNFLPFTIDLTPHVTPGARHVIALRIDSIYHAEDIPGPRLGWEMPCGILRPIELEVTSACHLDDIHIHAEPSANGAILRAAVDIANASEHDEPLSLELAVMDREGKTILAPLTKTEVHRAHGTGTVRIDATLPDGVELWSPETPTLYHAVFTLKSGDAVIDSARVRFGVRSVATAGRKVLLNGRPIRLAGFNRHEDTPERGMVANPAAARADLEAMKRMGCNFVRLAHYPHDPSTLDICDELGLLVLAEIPLYWWSDATDDVNRTILDAGKRQIAELIRRDRNHPSIIIWSVSNETQEHRLEAVRNGNIALVNHARACDPTRLITHVSFGSAITPETSVADSLICVNDYPGVNAVQRGEWDGPASADYWTRMLAEWARMYPDTPVFVTEFGYPAFHGLRAGTTGEVRQRDVLEAEFSGIRQSDVCGCVIWCWADHPWPKAVVPEEIRTSPYGVMNRTRVPKEAFAYAAEMFRDPWFRQA